MNQSQQIILCITLTFIFQGICFAQDNPHRQVPFSCETCHNETDWKVVDFEHTQTGFGLEGGHRAVYCRACHEISDFGKTDRKCRSCHEDIHQGRLTPDCVQCHSVDGWTVIDANTAHANTAFQLIGAHARLDCGACHQGEIRNAYLRLSSNCIDCHRTEFRNTQNPRHDQLKFGSRCERCHSMFAWEPAEYADHDSRFPIYSGEHAGVWDDCQTCHSTAGNYQVFSCLGCHAHRQSEMNDEHDDVAGYAYNSEACYSCHPGGGE